MTDLNRNFDNKSVLITGGTSGMGLETARQVVAQGARVVSTCYIHTPFCNSAAVLLTFSLLSENATRTSLAPAPLAI